MILQGDESVVVEFTPGGDGTGSPFETAFAAAGAPGGGTFGAERPAQVFEDELIRRVGHSDDELPIFGVAAATFARAAAASRAGGAATRRFRDTRASAAG